MCDDIWLYEYELKSLHKILRSYNRKCKERLDINNNVTLNYNYDGKQGDYYYYKTHFIENGKSDELFDFE